MIFRHLLNMQSHPTWVRGLKRPCARVSFYSNASHPTWVRGLKQNTPSLPCCYSVAPYVGAWIETLYHHG